MITRREFIKKSTVAGALLASNPQAVFADSSQTVSTVYVVFKCHLDVGFIAPQNEILRWYFDTYFPQAMTTAETLRNAGGVERYVWTTGSFLPYMYLAQATPDQQKRMELAFQAGDLAWHGLPFSWQSEMVDPSLAEAAIGLSKSLDERFGKKTIAAKMTDVPCHTRSLIAPLVKGGITLLDVGVNPASTPPVVPDLFRWRDQNGNEIMVLYHRHDYGSTLTVPNSEIAISVQVRGDNSGPHSIDEIKAIFADLGRQYPNAKIVAASLSTVADALAPYRNTLPIVTQEIGDTWVYGCASDPVKTSHYRELSRLRQEWIAQGKMSPCDAADMSWLPYLTLAAEHTWGCDVKNVLGDPAIYTPAEVKAAWQKLNFQKAMSTWAEKRANNATAIALLPPALSDEANRRIAALAPQPFAVDNLSPLASGEMITTKHYLLALDPVTGAITRLKDRRTGREWASASQPLGLFSYQTFVDADYVEYRKEYITVTYDWATKDFGKPGLDKYPVQHQTWKPSSQQAVHGRVRDGHRVVISLQMPDAGQSAPFVAWPGVMQVELILPDSEAAIQINFQWSGKEANRLPEGLWLSFIPQAPNANGWTIEKMGQPVSPLDIVSDGGRNLHAVTQHIRYRDSTGNLILSTLDAPVVSLGEPGLLNFKDELPDMTGGVHVSLFNNCWGTNYVMWLNDDMRFRFELRTA